MIRIDRIRGIGNSYRLPNNVPQKFYKSLIWTRQNVQQKLPHLSLQDSRQQLNMLASCYMIQLQLFLTILLANPNIQLVLHACLNMLLNYASL